MLPLTPEPQCLPTKLSRTQRDVDRAYGLSGLPLLSLGMLYAHAHVVCSCCMLMLYVHVVCSCSCCMLMLILYAHAQYVDLQTCTLPHTCPNKRMHTYVCKLMHYTRSVHSLTHTRTHRLNQTHAHTSNACTPHKHLLEHAIVQTYSNKHLHTLNMCLKSITP
jgi:hypothetical protein